MNCDAVDLTADWRPGANIQSDTRPTLVSSNHVENNLASEHNLDRLIFTRTSLSDVYVFDIVNPSVVCL